ncbi:MAG: hypothetical protein A3D47_00335 [Candidatus Colwellbacteria bacterium RIFCSPHIGHO2_02_FULL_43_15]|uniref:Uncharacterized protein n=2 Tax=Candidatus Colwelliibacteriota TaxID=1817904 RepID=A0A1G1Z2A8_9BACT|nr:MAG: hypothetical protein A3D47_00335 [Candidatus Colwellbacteria bacterium RIFCSPHIGHO2_02_FULL_43_15]OGY61356.1 MAG: hypothetical protein A3F99_02530 [Candidatus Colwellbacteria bacterium RIFCSPLOWO2_12_FULL_43_11]
MVIKTTKTGIICEARSSAVEAGEFKLAVDPTTIDSKATLILKTKTQLPVVESPMDIIQGPGEYEVAGIKIKGVNLGGESNHKYIRTMYLVEMDELNLCFLGEMEKDLDESFLENMGEVDILFVEGEDVKKITTLIKDIDPRMVVSKSDTSAKALAKELGQTTEPVDRLSVKKKDLDENETKLIWLRDLGK